MGAVEAAAGNTAPTITDIADQQVEVGEQVSVQYTVGDAESAASDLTVTALSSDTAVATVAVVGTGAQRTVTVTGVSSGTATITVTVTDEDGSTATDTFIVTVNALPTISDVTDQTVASGASQSVMFTVGDDETAASNLTVTAMSSDTGVATTAISGTGAQRTVTITGVSEGTATITLTVTDEDGATATDTFVVTVTANTAPTISDVPNQTVADGATRSVSFSINDAESAPDDLTVTAMSSDTGVATATISGTGAQRTVTITGVSEGTATITLTVTDEDGATATDTFTVTVAASGTVPAVSINPVLVVGGSRDGRATVYTPSGGQFGNPVQTPAGLFPGFSGVVRTATGDVNGDSIPDIILVTGPGTPIRFAVISGADNTTVLIPPTAPFQGSEDFAGGGFVSAGDIDNDGRAEIVVTPDQGGGPRVTIFSLPVSGTTPVVRANFLGIDDANFRGGARTALGDVNRDGTLDLAVAAGFLGGPRVAVFDGTTLFSTPTRLVNDFFAFPGPDVVTLRNGVYVAAGDLDGDGFADLIFGGGPGGGPRVFILSGAQITTGNVAGAQTNPIANFFVAGDSEDRGGIRLAAVDADGDGLADVVTGSGEGNPRRVRVYQGDDFSGTGEPGTFQDLAPFGGEALTDGVFVG